MEATKISPDGKVIEKDVLKAVDQALATSATTGDRIRKITNSRGFQNFLFGGLFFGLAVAVREIDRQRRIVERVDKEQETVLQFVKTLIDVTDCGEQAYVTLQALADAEEEEDNEATAVLAPDDLDEDPEELESDLHDEIEMEPSDES